VYYEENAGLRVGRFLQQRLQSQHCLQKGLRAYTATQGSSEI
jgi:hypothetical protein